MLEINLANVAGRIRLLPGGRIYEGEYDLNLFGCRILPGTPNAFDDVGGAFWRHRGVWQFRAWPITLDPGSPSLSKGTRKRADGTAIMVHDRYYRSCWRLGAHHKGRADEYPALEQATADAFEVQRDRDDDGRPTYAGPILRNVTGLNYHRAGNRSTVVGAWSEACVVTAEDEDHDDLMELAERQKREGHGDLFSFACLGWT